MSDIQYPPSLPLPLRNGYGANTASPLMRTEMQSGRARQRRKFTNVPVFAGVSWILTRPQAMIFESWFKNTLVDGAEWFTIKLRLPIGFKDFECRFVDIPQGPELVGIELWRYTADLELKDRETLAPGFEILPTFIEGLDIFDQAMNREWPEA